MNKIILLIGITLFSLSACSDKEEVTASPDATNGYSDAQKANLTDKVWYPTGAQGGLELEFLSDGTFRQALSLEGVYSWRTDNISVAVTDYAGKKFNMRFESITSSEMKYRTDLGGNNFTTLFTFRDTK
jgi:hypothetical protein